MFITYYYFVSCPPCTFKTYSLNKIHDSFLWYFSLIKMLSLIFSWQRAKTEASYSVWALKVMHSHSSVERHARIKAACHSMNELLTHLQGGLWYIEAWSYQGGAGLFHWFSGCWIKCPINLRAAALQSPRAAREGERACALVYLSPKVCLSCG